MQSIPDIIRNLQARLAADQKLASFINGRFVLQLDGPDGGQWLLDSSLGNNEQTESECRMQISSSDFLAIMSGSLNPQLAFLKGQIRLAGDADLALKFVRLCTQ